MITAISSSQQLHVSAGTRKQFKNFHSKYVAERNVDWWLPDDYSASKKYAVLYMQDDQMNRNFR